MGLRFRKSFKVGKHFKINVSKSGIGYSCGFKGYRHSVGGNGRSKDTYSIPGTGISYVSGSKKRAKKANNSSQHSVHVPTKSELGLGDTEIINSAKIDNFRPTEYSEIIKFLESTILIDGLLNVEMIAAGFAAFTCISKLNQSKTLVTFIIFCILLIAGISCKVFMYKTHSYCFDYELDEQSLTKYKQISKSVINLKRAKCVWQVLTSTDVTNKKINAGANHIVKRKATRVLQKPPYYLRSNFDTPVIELKKEKLVFMPDVVLMIRGLNVGVIKYSDLSYNCGYTRFVESGAVASDATVIGHTWQYVNANGTPDKRYSKNRKLTECRYGKIDLSSPNGLRACLLISNKDLVDSFRL